MKLKILIFFIFFSSLVLLLLSTIVQATEYRETDTEVKAEDVLKHIENGEDINLKNCRIVGELNLSKIELETVPNPRYEELLVNSKFYNLPSIGDGENLLLMEEKVKSLPEEEKEEYYAEQRKLDLTCPKVKEELRVVEGKIAINNCSLENDLDFSGALFEEPLSLTRVNCSSFAIFIGSYFKGHTDFREANFNNNVYSSLATFNGDADFFFATFNNPVDFYFVTFNNSVIFHEVTFNDTVDFQRSYFICPENYCLFGNTGGFEGTIFNNDADFSGATFDDSARFVGATFNNSAIFRGVTFNNPAQFWGSTVFNGIVDFTSANFNSTAVFGQSTFNDAADFSWATFNDTADFAPTTFAGTANFKKATFNNIADFRSTYFGDSVEFSGSTFDNTVDFSSATFIGTAIFKKVTFNDTAKLLVPDKPENIISDWASSQKFINSYESQGQFEDEDIIYYNYRKEVQAQKKWSDISKWTDLIKWATCGYGVKLSNTFYFGGTLVVLFSVIYLKGPSLKMNNKRIPIKFHFQGPVFSRPTKNPENESQNISFKDALHFSINLFTNMGYGKWDLKDDFKKWATLEKVLGWVMLGILATTISNVVMKS